MLSCIAAFSPSKNHSVCPPSLSDYILSLVEKGERPQKELVLQKIKLSHDHSPDEGYAEYRRLKAHLKRLPYALSNLYLHLKESSEGREILADLKAFLKCNEGAPAAYREFKRQIFNGQTSAQIHQEIKDIRHHAESVAMEKLRLAEKERQSITQEVKDELKHARIISAEIIGAAKDEAHEFIQRAHKEAESMLDQAKRTLDCARDAAIVDHSLVNDYELIKLSAGGRSFTLRREDAELFDDLISVLVSGRWRCEHDHGALQIECLTGDELEALIDFRLQKPLKSLSVAAKAADKSSCVELLEYCEFEKKRTQLKNDISTLILSLCYDLEYSKSPVIPPELLKYDEIKPAKRVFSALDSSMGYMKHWSSKMRQQRSQSFIEGLRELIVIIERMEFKRPK